MATTGFWPVRGYLKKVLEYADNPDKTTEKKYLDDDLYAALRYTENDGKTDERKYVSGINCSAAFAYEEMTAVKRQFGERGKVIAYHGFQSFLTGEVTPEQAHEIGLETARRMWGKDFQVLVTTHLNTDNLHCHFVVNSVSFLDGHKFRNSIEQHRELREISDAICKEHGLSVLADAPFYGGQSRGTYWREQHGQPTHRQQLKEDIEYCLRYSSNWEQFIRQLNAKGYSFDPSRVSVKADGWQRAVRLDRLGYPDEYLDEQLDKNAEDPEFRYRYQEHKPHVSSAGVLMRVVVEMGQMRRARLPLSQAYKEYQPKKDSRSPVEQIMDGLIYEANHTHDTAVILADAILAILLALIELASHYTREVILTAELRYELQNVSQFHSDYRFLKENRLHSVTELDRDMEQAEKRIAALTDQRSKLRNRVRHETDPQILSVNKAQRAAITTEITEQRKRVKRVLRIRKDTPRLLGLPRTELRAEYELKHPTRAASAEGAIARTGKIIEYRQAIRLAGLLLCFFACVSHRFGEKCTQEPNFNEWRTNMIVCSTSSFISPCRIYQYMY